MAPVACASTSALATYEILKPHLLDKKGKNQRTKFDSEKIGKLNANYRGANQDHYVKTSINMDPLTAASSFAAIVGLIANYRQEKSQQNDLSYKDFVEWLEYHRHADIVRLINNTADMQNEINCLLREDHEKMLNKLDEISSVLSSIFARIEGYSGLALLFARENVISDQANHILTSLVDSNSSEIGYISSFDGIVLQLMSDGPIQIEQPRFLDDDLDTLVKFGLLSVRIGSAGTTFYRITRNAAQYVSVLKKKEG